MPREARRNRSQRKTQKKAGKSQPIPRAVQSKLRRARIAHLATVDPSGTPHVVPVCFTFDGLAFYTALDRKAKQVAPEKLARVRNIRANPEVALIIDRYDEDWTRLWYILVRGKADLLVASERKLCAKVIRQLRHKYRQYAAGMLADNAAIIRVTARQITIWGAVQR
jgi:PPOX class probable F420-dependent enzyme